ncbi:cyclophilin-like fold protein [Streptomyces sp. WI04-05B]|uniref:cyclophilin-like fold protein n=1 Tax=Streptomyces TaxID=1883 RepID=UPI0029A77973|nr:MULTISPECIES: cyclophilin-like fold protein [unclassified Streptomyces]MDX2546473.1 cyclophilin-like fold protein [Streptomyces sp. WI04-05B]MDX2586166.1 cyclophilin-like fold protein [Streptomyces sp. WI04-05A]
MNIRITIDGTPVDATLNDSAAARDFAAQLPLTLSLTDFHRNEKIADLPRPLSASGAPSGVHPRTGDLAYYAPWATCPKVPLRRSPPTTRPASPSKTPPDPSAAGWPPDRSPIASCRQSAQGETSAPT